MRPTPAALAALAALTPLALAAAPAARAQTTPPVPPPVIDACYVPASGTIYRVNAAGAPANCLSPTHVRFTWNQQGLKGDKGDTGAKGEMGATGPKGDKGDTGPAATLQYARVSTAVTVLRNTYRDIAKDCPSGRKVVGGGFQVVGGLTSAQEKLQIMESYPSSDTRWQVSLVNASGTTDFPGFIYAVCL